MAHIELPAEQMQGILGKAILDSLTEDARQQIIVSAINHLNTAPKDTYGRPAVTPLREAFESAVYKVTREMAEGFVKEQFTPHILAALSSLLPEGSPDTWEINDTIKLHVMQVLFDELRKEQSR